MKQILVAVDEHPHGAEIVDEAIKLASAMSAKILLIYVSPKQPIPEAYRDSHGDALPEHFYEDQFARAMGPLIKKIQSAGVKCEGVSRYGKPDKEILKTAQTKNVDYIMVGARGLQGLRRIRAIASVSRNVIENSPIPVIAVP